MNAGSISRRCAEHMPRNQRKPPQPWAFSHEAVGAWLGRAWNICIQLDGVASLNSCRPSEVAVARWIMVAWDAVHCSMSFSDSAPNAAEILPCCRSWQIPRGSSTRKSPRLWQDRQDSSQHRASSKKRIATHTQRLEEMFVPFLRHSRIPDSAK